jgi:alpha-glucosidase
MSSPDKRISFVLTKDHSYVVLVGEDTIARMNFGMRLGQKEREPDVFYERIECVADNTVNGHYNEYLLSLKTGDKPAVRLCIYNDAIAFRYEYESTENIKVIDENSFWTLSDGTIVWYFERDNHYKLKSYAGSWKFTDIESLDTVSRMETIQGAPLIFEFKNGLKGFLSEAALKNYSGLRLNAIGGNKLKSDFTEKDGFDVGHKLQSPWRVLFIGNDLTELVNQDVIKGLSPGPDPVIYEETSYIKPGKCAWRWFAKGTGNFEQERDIIDKAALLNFQYSMIDEGWNKWENAWNKISELAVYGKQRNIGLILWKHSKEILSPENDYGVMCSWLDSIADSGAAGVKVDFMDSEAKYMIDFDLKLLEEAAKRKLLVVLHGCQKPTGEQYSYPNEITREGVRGIELNKMSEGYITAAHNAALPFTRFVVGNADYTPLTFTMPGETTFAHQLATLVCFTSTLQVIAEDPEILLENKYITPALDFIRQVPTVWDETIALPQSEIGKLVVMARRSGKNWYIGILNGEEKQKEVSINMDSYHLFSHKITILNDDIFADKILLPMKGHRSGKMERIASLPFRVSGGTGEGNIPLVIAPNGGAVIMMIFKPDN